MNSNIPAEQKAVELNQLWDLQAKRATIRGVKKDIEAFLTTHYLITSKGIDFTKINFGELFRDFEEKSRISIDAKKASMQNNVGEFKGNPGQELINKKFKIFMEKEEINEARI